MYCARAATALVLFVVLAAAAVSDDGIAKIRDIQAQLAAADVAANKAILAVNEQYRITPDFYTAGREFPHAVLLQYEEIEHDLAKRVAELRASRNEVTATMDGFWLRVAKNHPGAHTWLLDGDAAILAHLIGVESAYDSVENDLNITLTFSENPYFTDKQLWRADLMVFEQGFPNATLGNVSGVTWKDGKKPAGKSFFDAFMAHHDGALDHDVIHDLVKVFANDLYRDPTPFIDAHDTDYAAHGAAIAERRKKEAEGPGPTMPPGDQEEAAYHEDP